MASPERPAAALEQLARECGFAGFIASHGGSAERWEKKHPTSSDEALATVEVVSGSRGWDRLAYVVLGRRRPVHCLLDTGYREEVLQCLLVSLAKDAEPKFHPFLSTLSQILGGTVASSLLACTGGQACKKNRRAGHRPLGLKLSKLTRISSAVAKRSQQKERMLIPPSCEHAFFSEPYQSSTSLEKWRKTLASACGSKLLDDIYSRVHQTVRKVCGLARTVSDISIRGSILQAISRCLLGAHVEGALQDRTMAGQGTIGPGTGGLLPRSLSWQGGRRGSGSPVSVRVVGRQSVTRAASMVTDKDVVLELLNKESGLALRSHLLNLFPRKPHPEAGSKCNIYLDSLLIDVHRFYPHMVNEVCALLESLPARVLYDDQVCGCILHSLVAAKSRESYILLGVCLLGVTQVHKLKALSDILKGTGNHTQLEWAKVVELSCLIGRGATDFDLREDAVRRVRDEPYWEVNCPEGPLREAIMDTLVEELSGKTVELDSVESHWAKRFEWCVAGSHNWVSNHDCGFPRVPQIGPGGNRVTRRMAMEYTARNPLLTWDGCTKVSVIPKLEHGKTRAIYSCNTASYTAFGRLLRPVEKAWRGRRVILDPGAGGNYGMFRRIRLSWPSSLPIALMLDYADFNSQHTIRAQQLVIECLSSMVTGMGHDDLSTLVNSFSDTHLYLEGQPLGRVKRSLMSGHRGTSFINSVLNAAYIRMVLGRVRYESTHTFHVGDDVLMFCRTIGEAEEILDSMERAGFRLQASKQSLGPAGFEFLRMAGTRRAAHGYLARAVSSCVSGNWVTEWADDPAGSLQSLVQMARSIINRSVEPNAWQLLLSSAHSQTNIPRDILAEVLSGNVAVGAGPCYRSDGRYEFREILEASVYGGPEKSDYTNLPRHATEDYFRKGCSDVERYAMELCGFKPWNAALRSSYGDLADSCTTKGKEVGRLPGRIISLGPRALITKAGEVTLDTELDKAAARGKLTQYPVIALLQHALKDEQIGILLNHLGIQSAPGTERVTAFGGTREGAVIKGWLPYADAAALGSRAVLTTVRILYPLYM